MKSTGCLPSGLFFQNFCGLFTKKRKQPVVSSTAPEIEPRPPSLVVDEKALNDVKNIIQK